MDTKALRKLLAESCLLYTSKRAMRPENLLKIATALEVSADYLLTGDIIDKDLLILSDKLRRLTPSQVQMCIRDRL